MTAVTAVTAMSALATFAALTLAIFFAGWANELDLGHI